MSVSQLCHCSNRIQSSILCQGVRNHFHSLRELPEAVSIGTRQSVRVQHQLSGDLSLRGSTTSNQESLLDQASNDTEGVMNGSVSFLQHKLVRTTHNDGASLARCGHPGDLDTLCRTSLHFFHQIGGNHVLRGEMVQGGDRTAPDCLAQEFYVFSFDILHHHDLHLVKEVHSKIRQSVSQNGLLDQKNVTSCFLDLFNDVKNVSSLLSENTIHSCIIRHHDLIVHIRLWWRNTELNETNLSLFHLFGTVDIGSFLLEHHSIN